MMIQLSICRTKTKTGKSCRANALKDKPYCLAHSPEPGDQQNLAVARSKGGSVTHWRGSEVLDLDGTDEIKTPKDVLKILNKALQEVRKGDLSPNVAGAMVYICNAINATLRLMYDTQETSSGPVVIIKPEFRPTKNAEPIDADRQRIIDKLDSRS